MNQEYISSLERLVHASRFNLVKADTHIKDMTQKNKILQQALKLMEKENQRLKKVIEFEKEKYLCNVCFQETKDCIIEPCRHFAGCQTCCTQLNTCPICRTEIDSYITLFNP